MEHKKNFNQDLSEGLFFSKKKNHSFLKGIDHFVENHFIEHIVKTTF